jgi:hypothetical protein
MCGSSISKYQNQQLSSEIHANLPVVSIDQAKIRKMAL